MLSTVLSWRNIGCFDAMYRMQSNITKEYLRVCNMGFYVLLLQVESVRNHEKSVSGGAITPWPRFDQPSTILE